MAYGIAEFGLSWFQWRRLLMAVESNPICLSSDEFSLKFKPDGLFRRRVRAEGSPDAVSAVCDEARRLLVQLPDFPDVMQGVAGAGFFLSHGPSPASRHFTKTPEGEP